MTLKLKIFKTIMNPNIDKEKDDPRDSYLIDALVQDHVMTPCSASLRSSLNNKQHQGREIFLTLLSPNPTRGKGWTWLKKPTSPPKILFLFFFFFFAFVSFYLRFVLVQVNI